MMVKNLSYNFNIQLIINIIMYGGIIINNIHKIQFKFL